jgi:hypothetical protein
MGDIGNVCRILIGKFERRELLRAVGTMKRRAAVDIGETGQSVGLLWVLGRLDRA